MRELEKRKDEPTSQKFIRDIVALLHFKSVSKIRPKISEILDTGDVIFTPENGHKESLIKREKIQEFLDALKKLETLLSTEAKNYKSQIAIPMVILIAASLVCIGFSVQFAGYSDAHKLVLLAIFMLFSILDLGLFFSFMKKSISRS
ncbi:hypothetical protein [Leptospira andrefontaineae]|uniref:Uncharacterized protein n=1 Tax=Leptospira andrefontaineae TaxID=2484976 RepID=A0A4R9GX16_9LEPT|nr:hypothetical protein [Leptospira andrefontaineae]TGK36261.1 hypothetical protein EHO65_18345 [Leptospira andrefontaineae]